MWSPEKEMSQNPNQNNQHVIIVSNNNIVL